MTENEIIRHVDDGVCFYLDFFANAKHMEKVDTGFYFYTRPLPDEHGISFVYGVRLEGLPKDRQLEKIEVMYSVRSPVIPTSQSPARYMSVTWSQAIRMCWSYGSRFPPVMN